MQLAERFSPTERLLVRLMLAMVNPLRAALTPPLPTLTQAEVVQMVRQLVQQHGEG
jgi:hypothetical protein